MDSFGEKEQILHQHLPDRASARHRTWHDICRSLYWKFHPKVVLGTHVTIKAHVEILLTDNARLIIGDYCTLDCYALLKLTKPNPNLVIGNHVGIGRNTILAAKSSIVIGDYTQIGPYCQINDHGHGTKRDDLIMNQKAIIEPVSIGRDCWLGSGVRVLKGIRIGDGAVVGAGSVVTADVPPYEIWAGVPARKIKERD